jgi:hypothetical protein
MHTWSLTALASAQATLKLSERQVEALKAQRNGAVASLAQATAQRDQAQLFLCVDLRQRPANPLHDSSTNQLFLRQKSHGRCP